MDEKAEGALGWGFAIAIFAFGAIQIYAGWLGLEDSFGWGWAVIAAVLAILFRFTIPIAIGAFLCAKNIWEWHWALALLFALPGLVFMIPAVFASMVSAVRNR